MGLQYDEILLMLDIGDGFYRLIKILLYLLLDWEMLFMYINI